MPLDAQMFDFLRKADVETMQTIPGPPATIEPPEPIDQYYGLESDAGNVEPDSRTDKFHVEEASRTMNSL